MKKLYYILREDFFKCDNRLPLNPHLFYVGSLWIQIYFSLDEAENYKYSKTEVE